MKTPLIIYLDTQDYIKIFNEPEDGPHHRVLAELMGFRDRGDVVVSFSFATIMEFITKPNAANRSERVKRGQLIKDICGPNAFPYPSDIPKGASFPNGGMWMFREGDKIISAREFRQQTHSALREADNTLREELLKADGLNRAQRRQLGRKTPMKELIHQAIATRGGKRSDWGDLPISKEVIESRLLERFLMGQVSDREFETRINAWLFDPAEYSRILYDYADHPNAIEKFFGAATDTIERHMASIQEAGQKIQSLNEDLLDFRNSLREAGVGKAKARNLTKQLPIPEPDPQIFASKLAPLLGEDRCGHFAHYFTRAKVPGYAFKRSDVMDLFQMCYAYDCGLFRCDKAMSDIFKNYLPFKGKLVAKFEDLPRLIAKMVN